MPDSYKDRMYWYIEHRIEYLNNQLSKYKGIIESRSGDSFDIEAIRLFLETRARIRELQSLLERMERW